jgi:hypothetical protein
MRPSLQHVLDDETLLMTLCGQDVTRWSRAYQKAPIKEILCKKCGKSAGVEF